MRNMTRLLLLAVLLISAMNAHAQWSEKKAIKKLNKWIEKNKEGVILEINPDEQWEIQCPIGVVCDENYDYRMFILESEGNGFTISFEPELATGITLEKLNSLVKYFSMYYSPLDLSKKGWQVRVRLENDVIRSGISFTSWEDGESEVHINAAFVSFELTNMHDTDCLDSYKMMDSSIKEGCVIRIAAKIPVEIVITAPMETNRVEDNTNVDW